MPEDRLPEEYVVYNGKRMPREWAEAIEQWQLETHFVIEGIHYARIPYGSEKFRNPIEAEYQLCRHCYVRKGQLHDPLCDWEECPCCGFQSMSCDCVFEGHQWEEAELED
jgi:hypothetical protein